VDIFRLALRRRIGSFQHTIEAIPIPRPGLNPLDDSFVIAAPALAQRHEALAWG
jgi:hypothetical protein